MGMFDGALNTIGSAFGMNSGDIYSMLPFGMGQGYANAQNLDFQKEQFSYQQNLQQTMFDREDNAVQRRAADMTAAGFSPTLAAGNAAQAGPVVSTQAPQRGPSPDVLGNVMNLLSSQQNISKTAQDQKVAEAQEDKINSEKALTDLTTEEKAYNLEKYQGWHLPTNASGFGKDVVQLQGIVDTFMKKLTQPSPKNDNKPPVSAETLDNILHFGRPKGRRTEDQNFTPPGTPPAK
nr:MAG: DNA pilot protein [Microviridae sp.]